MNDPRAQPRRHPLLLVATATAVFAAGVALWQASPGIYRRLFGAAPPLAVLAGAALLVPACLAVLRRHGFAVYRPAAGRPAWVYALAAVGLAANAIAMDLLAPFARDINVTAPASLVFYPVIAWLAELTFHLAPLALILTVAGVLTRVPASQRVRTAALVAVTFIEPAFQLAFTNWSAPPWAQAYLAAHILIINLIGVHLLARRGFVAMLGFRLGYYLLWHIAWGYLRLELLFTPGA